MELAHNELHNFKNNYMITEVKRTKSNEFLAVSKNDYNVHICNCWWELNQDLLETADELGGDIYDVEDFKDRFSVSVHFSDQEAANTFIKFVVSLEVVKEMSQEPTKVDEEFAIHNIYMECE